MDIFFYLTIACLSLSLISGGGNGKIRLSVKGKSSFIIICLTFLLALNFFVPLIDNAESAYLLRSIRYSVKFVLLFLFFLLINAQSLIVQRKYVEFLLKGFLTAIVIHAVYSWFIMYGWYVMGFDYHTVFLNSFGVTEESVGHVLLNFIFRPIIRPSGLHWDPAYFGLWGVAFLLCVYLGKFSFKKKMIYFFIIGIPWILALSRTAIFSGGMSLITIVLLIYPSRIVLRKIILGFTIIVMLGLAFLWVKSYDAKEIDLNKIVESRTDVKSNGTKRHIYYPFYVMETLCHDPFHFTFGYGNRNSGRAFRYADVDLPGWDVKTKPPFDIESDWFKTMANQGILGLILYVLLYYYLIKGLKIKVSNFTELDNYTLFLLLILLNLFWGGFFYIFNDSKWVWFVIFATFIKLNDTEKNGLY
ncbi:O-antigen ligase family protein [Ancylomarina sp. YFZ004]